jgi:vacuolar-type H+-ATPase subunit H
MLDQLRVILAAEAEARQRLDAARADAQRRLADAEAEARRLVQAARDAEEATAAAVEKELMRVANQTVAAMAADSRAKADALQAQAEPHLDAAAQAIVACILGRDEGDDR